MIQEEINMEKNSEHFIRTSRMKNMDFRHTGEIMEEKIIQENKILGIECD